MKCPICKTDLVITGSERLETICEHVSDPNGSVCEKDVFQCPNNNCKANEYGAVWEERGEFFTYNMSWDRDKELEKCFIGENNGPFGTISRRLNVEIYKCGLKNKVYYSPILTFWLLKPYKEYWYKANKDGEILKSGWKIKFLKKGHGNKGYYIGWISGIHMFKYVLREYKRKKESFKKAESEFLSKSIVKIVEKAKKDDRWWYKWFYYHLLIFENNTINQAKKINHEKNS